MSLQIGDTAPDFTAETTQGTLRFHEWIDGSWCVFFSHPKNFTPVCTTELGYTAKLKPDFDQRGVKVIGLSCDAVDNHHKWSQDIEETQGHAPNFPLVADHDRESCESVRNDPSERQRHNDRSLGVCHRAGEEDQADAELPR